MRRSPISYERVGHLDLPSDLAKEVKALLYDPLTKRTRYGALRQVSTMLFSNWVDTQRDPSPDNPYFHTPEF